MARHEHELVADAHAALAVEPAVATDELDVPVVEPGELTRVVEVVDHLVAPRQHRGDIELALGCLGRPGDAPRLCQRLGRAQQRLRRHAGPVGALAPDQLALDESDFQAGSAELSRGNLARRASSDDDDVHTALVHATLLALDCRSIERSDAATPGIGSHDQKAPKLKGPV